MKKIACITDIHGCYKTLLALVAKIPSDYEIILGGDLIDRGPDSARVVRWAMENKIRAVIGNHEDMMLFYSGIRHKGMPYDSRSIWLYNGGGLALESFGGEAVPEEVLAWVNALPFAIREGDFEISHTGYGGFENTNRMQKLWLREGSDAESLNGKGDGIFRIFGHTQRQEPWLEKNFAMIDTGCAYKDRGLGKLTAYLIPDKIIIQQDNIE